MVDFDVELAEAIEAYNTYRSPMATATLLEQEDDWFRVRFEGPFCTTCCRDDYFEDLIYELHDLGVNIAPITVTAIEHTALETFIVEFAVTHDAHEQETCG